MEYATGLIRGLDDVRDYTIADVAEIVGKAWLSEEKTTVDLREYMPPIWNQGSLGSCTAHGLAALVCYYQLRKHGKYTMPSRLFLYKTARYLARINGDKGAYVKSAMGGV